MGEGYLQLNNVTTDRGYWRRRMREWSFKPLSFNLPLMSLVFHRVAAHYSEGPLFRTSAIRVKVWVRVHSSTVSASFATFPRTTCQSTSAMQP